VLGSEPGALTVAALRVREGREVYLCSDGERAVVAKCYPDRERASAAASALELLGGAHGPLLVPECLALDAGGRVVVQTHLRGRPLGERLAAGAGDEAVARVAAAVGALHGLGVRLPAEVSRATTPAAAEGALRRPSGAGAGLVAGYEAASGATVAPLAAAYALLVLARKLAWLAPGRREPVRSALEALVSSPLAPLAPR